MSGFLNPDLIIMLLIVSLVSSYRTLNIYEDQMKERLKETDGSLGKMKNDLMQEMANLRQMLEKAVEQISVSRSQSGGKKSLELLVRKIITYSLFLI